MNQFRIVADSSCDILTLDGADFVSVPLTIRTDTEEFRDDDFLDVNEMVTVLRSTKGRSYSACPNIADWTEAFGDSGDVIAFTITSSLSGSYSTACAAKKHCEELDPSRRICVVDSLSAGVWYVAIDFQLFALFALLLWCGRGRPWLSVLLVLVTIGVLLVL